MSGTRAPEVQREIDLEEAYDRGYAKGYAKGKKENKIIYSHRNGEETEPTETGYYWIVSLVDGEPFDYPYINGRSRYGGKWLFPHDPGSSRYYGPIPCPVPVPE